MARLWPQRAVCRPRIRPRPPPRRAAERSRRAGRQLGAAGGGAARLPHHRRRPSRRRYGHHPILEASHPPQSWFPPSDSRRALAGACVRCVRVAQTRWWQRRTRAGPSGSRRPTDSPPAAASRRRQQQNWRCAGFLPPRQGAIRRTDCSRCRKNHHHHRRGEEGRPDKRTRRSSTWWSRSWATDMGIVVVVARVAKQKRAQRKRQEPLRATHDGSTRAAAKTAELK